MTHDTTENGLMTLTLGDILRKADRELVDGIQALEVLSTMTEDEFLHVGSKLEDFYGRAARMAELSRSAAGLVSGEEIRQTMDGLKDLVGRVSSGLKHSEAMTEVSLPKLKHIVDLIDGIYDSLDDLETITRTLNMLGLSMIIQNATLTRPVGSLQALGEDVRQLSSAIDLKAAQIAEETREAAESITTILNRLGSLRLTQQTKVAGILKKTMSGISSLSEKYDLSARITGDISEISSTVWESIGNIVTSAQAHDIVRQQFEGSAEAFRKLRSELAADIEEAEPSSQGATALESAHKIAKFCETQSSQLILARNGFVSAAKKIILNLTSLSRTVKTIVEKSREVISAGNSGERSFLLLVESDIDSVRSALSALSETVQIGNEISGAIIVVIRTSGRLSGFTDDVENIGDRIALIALNAEVKAEGIGQEGRGLAVIAESIQRISVQAQDCIQGISDSLRSITEAADDLSEAVISTGEQAMPREDEMARGLRNYVDRLSHINEKMFSFLTEGEEFGQSLSDDIQTVTRTISVHESVTDVTDEILANLGDTGSAANKMIFECGEEDNFRERVREAKSLLSGEKTRPPAAGTSDLGNNVELF